MGKEILFEAITHNQTMLMPNLVIASANAGKIAEFQKLLFDFPLRTISQPKELDVNETGNTFLENARLKAIAAGIASGEKALGDDSGLCVDALGGAPGIHSARYAINDSKRISRLLKELEPFDNRNASFYCSLCLASPEGDVLFEVEGQCNGVIAVAPRGNNGFGYDPIFEVKGTGLTYAEMSHDKKQSLSHRSIAFHLLIPGLKTTFNF